MNKTPFKFNKTYFFLAIFIFLIEVIIALYINDSFIRPYFGDVLVVILIYCFIKSFLDFPIFATCLGVLLFSFCIEFLQYFELVNRLGLQDNRVAKIVLGTSFAIADLLAYLAGIIIVYFIEKNILKRG